MSMKSMKMEALLKEPEGLEKIRSIITYFTYKLGGKYLSTRRLMKLYYMAELRSIEKHGRRLSKAKFWNWDYGPWSLDVVLVADTVDGIKTELQEPTDKYSGKRYVPLYDKTKVFLNKEEMEILDKVLTHWKWKKTDKLVKETKSFAPFTWSSLGEEIPFDKLIECYDKTYRDKSLLASIKESRKEIAQNKITSIASEADIKAFINNL